MRRFRRWGPALLLVSPSLLLIGLFVYGFAGWNAKVSTSTSRGYQISDDYIGTDNYEKLFADERFGLDVRNVLIFTLVFVLGAMATGLVLALLLERGIRFESFFRSSFIFPMALSLIAVGIVWRWLLKGGEPVGGLNKVFDSLGLDFLVGDWYQSGSSWAIASIALPAGWALSGYIMALFLAGIRGVPDELREAARVDGANEPRVFWHIVRPMLWPVVMSALVILAHISLKTFDLLLAIVPKGNLGLDTPAMYMWYTSFDGGFYGRGATIATLLLAGIALVIVPYIWYSVRSERKK
ncbi:sugar ABC transporter permease [Actinorhabdospora filicis]|uniref:Sugar ABC transporter permease n=1 Tax=Actinorhabdospora filicis TaxID=1785913 RepID=A0A9W6SQ66_9ACTN|nr:sugar ABC transporter permease [Actinorhabdospora filicis]GLZ80098.1 sugar ABC transporter permease [Actinorhabdospora filicis]